jgi:hypothetical protein
MNFHLVGTVNDQNPGVVYQTYLDNLANKAAELGLPLAADFNPNCIVARGVAQGIAGKHNAHQAGVGYVYDDATRAADAADFGARFNKILTEVLDKLDDAQIIYTFFNYDQQPDNSLKLLLPIVPPENEKIGFLVERNDGLLEFEDRNQVGEMTSEDMGNFFKDVAKGGAAVMEPPKAKPAPAPVFQPVADIPGPGGKWEKGVQDNDFIKEVKADANDVKAQLLKALKKQQGEAPAVVAEPPAYQVPKDKNDAILAALGKALNKKREEENKIAARKAAENPKNQLEIRKQMIAKIEARRKAEEAVRQAKLAPIKDQLADAMKQQEALLVGSPAFDNQIPAFQQDPEFHGLKFNAEIDDNDKGVQEAKAILAGLNAPEEVKQAAPKKKANAKAAKALGNVEELFNKLHG